MRIVLVNILFIYTNLCGCGGAEKRRQAKASKGSFEEGTPPGTVERNDFADPKPKGTISNDDVRSSAVKGSTAEASKGSFEEGTPPGTVGRNDVADPKPESATMQWNVLDEEGISRVRVCDRGQCLVKLHHLPELIIRNMEKLGESLRVDPQSFVGNEEGIIFTTPGRLFVSRPWKEIKIYEEITKTETCTRVIIRFVVQDAKMKGLDWLRQLNQVSIGGYKFAEKGLDIKESRAITGRPRMIWEVKRCPENELGNEASAIIIYNE